MKTSPSFVVPKWMVLLFFWLGLMGAISVRLLGIVGRYDAEAALWLWRFSMVCYILFFGYRVWIGYRRRNLIMRNQLIEHVENAQFSDPHAQEYSVYILRSLMRSKELFNYTIIWGLSILAFLVDLAWS